MPFTKNFILPTEEELTVEEVNLTSAYLRAGAVHFGKYCDEPSKEFMLCKREEYDPRKCVDSGKDVTACAMDFFRKVKKNCRESFEAYAHCLENRSADMNVIHCRKTQAALDLCMLENLQIERPEVGYFARPRIHNTTRPKPEPFPKREHHPVIDELPEDFTRKPTKNKPMFTYI